MPRNCANSYGNGYVVRAPRLHKVRQLMLKRPFKSLIARIAIVALALSLVVPFVPAAFAQDTSIDYAENGTGPVQTFVLSDQDASSGGWSVSGADAALFEISSDGALSFKSSPNYESPADTGGDNVYNVTVNRSGGSLDVAITVTNVDETGSVSIDDLQPQAGESISASLSDPDGDHSETVWQWSKSMDEAEWSDITGATSSTYAPGTDDIGYYLRATATYSDGLGAGRDSASGMTVFAVERRPASNSQPSFTVQDEEVAAGIQVTRTVKETAKIGSSVGNAVTATDADNDPLLYRLTDGDEVAAEEGVQYEDSDENDDTPASTDGTSQWFQISTKTGQVGVSSSKSQSDVTTQFNQDVETPAATSYIVTVTATDPSGSNTSVQVTINVGEVNEAPTISLATEGATGGTIPVPGATFVVTTPEEVTLDLSGTDTTDPIAAGLPVFDANDPEEATENLVTWSLSGADGKRFDIVELATANATFNSSAVLRWATSDGKGPSFEDMDSADGDNVYLVTVTASDGVASKSQDVSITVENVEEYGTVSLTQLVPQEGIPVTARLSDQDGNIVRTEWQWYRGGTKATADDPDPRTSDGQPVEGLVTVSAATACADDNAASDANVCSIPGATSSTYIPKAEDDGHLLTAQATYVDGLGTDRNSARATSANDAEDRPNENDLPSFGDDESVDRSVAENAKDASVGDPVTAVDDDVLQYTIDNDAFKVDNSGQITTAKELDYETQSSYTVTVTATDPSLASASITVNITVTDTDDAATITAGSGGDYAENGTDPVQTYVLNDQDASSGGWSVSGPDAALFEISSDGALSFKSSPNYESPADEGGDNVYNVTVNRSGGSLDVVVTVTNVDETGSVSLDDLQPQAGESVSASLSDPDGDHSETVWQWSKSMDQADWSDITGATSATYSPGTDDIGYYLRATATYSDGLGAGRDSANTESEFAVERRPASNSQPSFAVQDEEVEAGVQVTRTVKETAKIGSSVGNAVTATDANNDPLLYRLTDGDTDLTTDGIQHENDDIATDTDGTATPSSTDGDSQWFQINSKTGQISVSTSKTQSAVTTEFDQEADTPNTSYTVTVTAIDPSGSTRTVQVTINVAEVDEAPVISLATTPGVTEGTTVSREGDTFVVTTPEEVILDLSGTDSTDTLATGLPIFNADDPEEDATDGEDKVSWSVSGIDGKRFDIEELADAEDGFNSSAALRWATADRTGPSFEDMDSVDGDNVYLVTVTASDGVASKSQLVTITVENVEEYGSVSLSQLVPQEGIAITARLSDNDGNIVRTEWQWYRGGTPATETEEDAVAEEDVTDDTAREGLVTIDLTTTIPDCTDTTADGTLCIIVGATSSTYIPKAADADNRLTARATYVDGLGSERNSTRATSANNAEARPNENDLPSFGDDESVDRSVAENAKGASVGDPVTAVDDDVLQYTIDNDAFKVDNSGQITTAKELDYETQSSYTVTVTATDPSLASASIVVNITVTDTDDAATITAATENNAPAFASESVTVSVDENAEAGAPVGDPIVATDKDGNEISYSLDDDSVVEVWPSGQLTVAEGANLDYEGDANSYTVTLTASDGISGSSIMVTINVANVGLDNGYDVDDNGEISKDEAVTAVDDYFLDNITRDEINEILALYFG